MKSLKESFYLDIFIFSC